MTIAAIILSGRVGLRRKMLCPLDGKRECVRVVGHRKVYCDRVARGQCSFAVEHSPHDTPDTHELTSLAGTLSPGQARAGDDRPPDVAPARCFFSFHDASNTSPEQHDHA